MDHGANNEVVMLRFLITATKVVGLTYKLAFTSVLIGTLAVKVAQNIGRRKQVR